VFQDLLVGEVVGPAAGVQHGQSRPALRMPSRSTGETHGFHRLCLALEQGIAHAVLDVIVDDKVQLPVREAVVSC